MKCPQCSRNQLRGKEGMVCKKCKYNFILDPKTHQMTDGKFLALIRKASREGTYYYTEDELYHIAALTAKKNWGCIGGGIFGTIFGLVFINVFIGDFSDSDQSLKFILSGVLVISAIFLTIRSIPAKLPRKRWDKIVRQWKRNSSEPIVGLIEQTVLHQPPPQEMESDIYQYGASRLVICQHDIQVDWLVLNNFHSANSAVIISENGYPGYIATRADELLQSNPGLEIVLVHDASEEGNQMKQRILSGWPIREGQIHDVGITKEMLSVFGVKSHVIKEFGDIFPLHALPYHHIQTLLSRSIHSISDGGTGDFVFIWQVTYGEDGDLGGDGDFG